MFRSEIVAFTVGRISLEMVLRDCLHEVFNVRALCHFAFIRLPSANGGRARARAILSRRSITPEAFRAAFRGRDISA